MLKRVSIQNFKSLKDVTLDLQKVNLLIGPNNSGKTNFLKALEGHTIGVLTSRSVSELEAISFKHKTVNMVYQFDYLPDLQKYRAEKYGSLKGKVYSYRQLFEINSIEDNELYVDNIKSDWLTDEEGTKSNVDANSGLLKEFFEFKTTKIYRPDPSKLVQQVKFSADQISLLPDCSNLIAFYFYLDANFKKAAQSIQKNMSKCIPEIAYFTIPPVKIGNESLLGLRFFDKEDNSYWADEVSEGVLYFLALLCIINQPNPPKLLLLEEPEKGIHPRRIEEVINFIFGLADDKDIQVIMTTHSPAVVDMFKDMPESVFIFDKDEEGATHVKNLQKDIIEPETEESVRLGIDPPQYLNGLGQAWKVGFIGGVPR